MPINPETADVFTALSMESKPMSSELWQKSATELAQAIRTQEVSSRAVIQAHLDRIAAVNPQVNAITLVLEEEALAMADAADEAIAAGEEVGPLHGVPFTVKENIDLAGSATTEGVPAFAQAIPPMDGPQVAQIKRAGAIPLARTNLPEFGLRWHTDNALHGATRNPWNPALTPGGSSAGEAVALATGMSPLGMGNDYGGSLRWPSQCAGTAAIRPSRGRVPNASALAPAESMLTLQMFGVQGPMARHVADVRLALSLMSGPDVRDPWWVPAPLQSPPLAAPIKVAVTKNPAGMGVDPAVAAGVERAAQALAAAGYAVEEVEPPLVAEAQAMWAHLAVTEIFTLILPMIQPIISEDAATFLNMVAELYPAFDLAGYAFSLADRNRIAREWSLFLQEYPLVLGPVATQQPFPVGMDTTDIDGLADFVRSLRLVVTASLLGLPAAIAPAGMDTESDLPQSVQIIGSLYRDDLCLDAAETIEQGLGAATPIDPRA
jgi:amidase